jgi:hypothetical protein
MRVHVHAYAHAHAHVCARTHACVLVWREMGGRPECDNAHTHKHIHTHMLYIYVYNGFALAGFLWTCNAQHYNGAHLLYLYKGTPSIFIREPLYISFALAGFLWACYAQHYKGELVLRMVIASLLFYHIASLPVDEAPDAGFLTPYLNPPPPLSLSLSFLPLMLLLCLNIPTYEGYLYA